MPSSLIDVLQRRVFQAVITGSTNSHCSSSRSLGYDFATLLNVSWTWRAFVPVWAELPEPDVPNE